MFMFACDALTVQQHTSKPLPPPTIPVIKVRKFKFHSGRIRSLLHYVVARARHRTSGESKFRNGACNFTFVRCQIPKPQSDWCGACYLVRSGNDDDDDDATCRRLFSSSSNDDDNDATYVPPLDESSTESSDAPPFVDKPPKVQQSAGVRAAGLSFAKDVASVAKPRTTAFGRSRCTDRRDRHDVKRRRALKTSRRRLRPSKGRHTAASAPLSQESHGH
jgi:hypothetical protein